MQLIYYGFFQVMTHIEKDRLLFHFSINSEFQSWKHRYLETSPYFKISEVHDYLKTIVSEILNSTVNVKKSKILRLERWLNDWEALFLFPPVTLIFIASNSNILIFH